MTPSGTRSTRDGAAAAGSRATGAGLYFGVVQLFFFLSWVVYVIFLPRLAAQSGIGVAVVGWILFLDQVIFAVCDWAAGAAADRVAGIVGRVGRIVVAVTAVSTVAFLLLPWVTGAGSVAFVAVVVVWAITSSALRAPPLKILGRYIPPDQQPWVGALFLLGIGVASALGPFLSERISGFDPRLVFAVSAISVIALTLAIVRAERRLAGSKPLTPAGGSRTDRVPLVWFLVAVVLAAFAFQLHTSVNARPLFDRFAAPTEVGNLLSVFWVGFSLALMPASLLTKRFGGLAVMAAGALVAAASAVLTALAGGLAWVCLGQFLCGCAWASVVMSGVAAALAIGRPGSEGKAVGALFSVMALAAAVRIALVEAHLARVTVMPWLPVILWLAAGLMFTGVARRSRSPELPHASKR